MAKDKPSVSVALPKPGACTYTATLAIDESTDRALVVLPAVAFAPGKRCHVTLQWRSGSHRDPATQKVDHAEAFNGIPGAAWRIGDGNEVKAHVELDLPEGATGLRLSLFTDGAAYTGELPEIAKLSLA